MYAFDKKLKQIEKKRPYSRIFLNLEEEFCYNQKCIREMKGLKKMIREKRREIKKIKFNTLENLLINKLKLLRNQVKEMKNLCKFFGGSSIKFLNQKLNALYLERSIIDDETKSLEESQTFFDADHSDEITSLEDLYSKIIRDIKQIKQMKIFLKIKLKEVREIKEILFLIKKNKIIKEIKKLKKKLYKLKEEKEIILEELSLLEKFSEEQSLNCDLELEIEILSARFLENKQQRRHLKMLIFENESALGKLKV